MNSRKEHFLIWRFDVKELLVATRNKKKLAEIKDLLKSLDFKITSLIDYPDLPVIVEDGDSFEANAIKKAVTIAMATKKLTMGEDSGLEVKALNNRPGVHSARYSGENATDEQNNRKLLKELRGIPLKKRQARYWCCVALVDAKKIIDVVNGSCSGIITEVPQGTNGFGYDPLFLIPRYKKTFGELNPAIKARISHRARALKKFRSIMVRRVPPKAGPAHHETKRRTKVV